MWSFKPPEETQLYPNDNQKYSLISLIPELFFLFPSLLPFPPTTTTPSPVLAKFPLHTIGLFKMLSRWIWSIFNIQIQSDRGHKLMLLMFQNNDKDLLVFSKCFRA